MSRSAWALAWGSWQVRQSSVGEWTTLRVNGSGLWHSKQAARPAFLRRWAFAEPCGSWQVVQVDFFRAPWTWASAMAFASGAWQERQRVF